MRGILFRNVTLLVRHLAAQRVSEQVLKDRLLRTQHRLVLGPNGRSRWVLIILITNWLLWRLHYIISEYFLKWDTLIVWLTHWNNIGILLAHLPLQKNLLRKALDASVHCIEWEDWSAIAVVIVVLEDILLTRAILVIINYVLWQVGRCLQLLALKMLQLWTHLSRLIH